MRPRVVGAAVAGALVVAGAVAGAVSFASPSQPRPVVLGGNVPIDAGATDPLKVAAYNSPSVVADPRHPATLAVAARIDVPQFSCALFVSGDSGRRWQPRTGPPPPGSHLTNCFAPDLAFGADGTLYASFASVSDVAGHGRVPDAAWVARSTDGGRSFSAPVQVAGPLSFEVRLAADRERSGRLYLTWVQASGAGSYGFAAPDNPVMAARSDDGGATWAPAVEVSPPARRRVIAPVPAVGGGGNLYLAYLDLGRDDLDYLGAHEGRGGEPYPGPWSVVMARSADGGKTWAESVVDAGVVPTQRVSVLFPPAPSLAVDPSGDGVHVGLADGRAGDPDVVVWNSGDGARSWSAPVRVNDTRPGDGTAQYLPALSVAPGGRLDVVYYDRREGGPDGFMNTVSFQSSADGGKTFGVRVRLSDAPFDSRIGLGSERGMAELGSRLGLVSTRAGALAVWSDTRAGVAATGKQDLARSVVSVPNAPSRTPLRAAGVVAVVLGLGALGWVAWGGRRARRGAG